jgi:hypothetical protein
MIDWVLIARFAELSGYSQQAVRDRICSGKWPEGLVWKKAEGRVHVSLSGFNTWVASGGTAFR